jgi:hypothetical protein
VLREKSKKRKMTTQNERDDGDDLKAGVDEIGLEGAGGRNRERDERREARRLRKLRKAEKGAAKQAEEFMDGLDAPPMPAATSFHVDAKKFKDKSAANTDAASGFMAALNGTSLSAPAQEDNEEEEPFDYANAPSLLASADAESAAKNKKDKKKKRKGRMDGFDPYKKALDTGKGLGRGQRERVGEGRTFVGKKR